MPVCPVCRQQHDADLSVCPNDGHALDPDDQLRPRQETLKQGTTVGEYVIDRHIGAGAYGDVYAAEHPIIGKRAAVKVLHKRYSAEPEVISRFIAEARAVNTIRHRNIVDIFSFGKLDDDRHYLIMELLEGQTLAQRLVTDPLSFGDALEILQGIADALDAAHEAGIAHRDLKPDNVFLVDEGASSPSVKLLDFGIAKLLGDAQPTHKTATGTAVGTPLYMAPEQARGRKVDERADVYAFGVVAYQLLSGSPPFDGESAIDVLFQHMTAPPPRLSSAGLPPELDGPLEAMLAKKPRDRPASAGEGLKELMAAAASCDLTRAVAIAKGYAPSTRKVVRTNPKVSLPTPKLGSEAKSDDPEEVRAKLSEERDALPDTVVRPASVVVDRPPAAETLKEGAPARTAATLASPAVDDDEDEPAATTVVSPPAVEEAPPTEPDEPEQDEPEQDEPEQDDLGASATLPTHSGPPRWLVGVGVAAIAGILLLVQLGDRSAQPTSTAPTTGPSATQATAAPTPSPTPTEEIAEPEPTPTAIPEAPAAEPEPRPEPEPAPKPAVAPRPRPVPHRPEVPTPPPPPPAVSVDDILNDRD